MRSFLFPLLTLIISLKLSEAITTCSWIKQDTVFILDASESISQNDFQLAKTFIIKMMTFIKNSNPDNRISFIVFGDEATLIFNFEKYTKLQDMIEQVSLARNENGLTAIGKALKLTFEALVPKMRKEVEKFVILFTDGTNNVYPSPYVYADHLKDAFVRIITVGIGSEINKKELTTIASPNLAITIGNFPNLMDNMRKIIDHVCVIVDPIPNEPCKLEQQDLVILLDSSESISAADYEISKLFLSNLLMKFQIGPENTRVAMLSFSDQIRYEFDFSLNDRNKILSKIKSLVKFGSLTGMGLALREAHTKFIPQQRPGVPFNILLLTDGFNNMFPRPLEIADKLKRDGANIISLGIGSEINLKELKAISSNDKILTVNSYDRLLKNMKTVLKAVTCG